MRALLRPSRAPPPAARPGPRLRPVLSLQRRSYALLHSNPSSTGAVLMALALIANSLSERAFKALGIEDIAYVKPIGEGGRSTYAIHAADGSQLAVVEDGLV